MARTRNAWLRRHVTDPYVRRARDAGYRSRAAYKLVELDRKDGLLRPRMRVLDLGAAPGGWTQVAVERVRPGGRVVAVDVLAITPLSGAFTIRGDFRDARVRARIAETLAAPADVVLCDLSPNLTGIAATDQARAAALIEAAAALARELLRADGVFVCKIFHGEAFAALLELLKESFASVQLRKPAASRNESRETYAVARAPREA